ncbi:hypothetical protein C8R46DRAFT_1217755 [Mycena filopes]|nr:hypothetical protein C8R46DRAFT_1217755 [Mycena filopes]
MRRYSLGTGRALTRPRRWNSTTSAQNSLGSVLEDLEEPVDGTPTTVPREGGPLERPYTPNLDLIASASTPGGLASRLARETLLRAGVHPSSLAQPSAAQPSTAQQPSAAQPSAAQPSAAQPSAAQPSAAQPFNFPPFTAQPFTAQPSSTARPEPKFRLSKNRLTGKPHSVKFSRRDALSVLPEKGVLNNLDRRHVLLDLPRHHSLTPTPPTLADASCFLPAARNV